MESPVQGGALARLWSHQLQVQALQFDADAAGRAASAERLDHLFFKLVNAIKPATFVEVGAFEADASLRVARDHPNTTCLAFEANPDTYERFSSVRDYSALGVDYQCLALSDSAGEVTFHQEDPDEPARAGSSSLLSRNVGGSVWTPDTPITEVVVPTKRLDEVVASSEGGIALWVDVEGASRQVLQGSTQLLADVQVMKVEVEDEPYWTAQWLSEDVLEFLLAADLTPIARDVEYPGQFNILLAGKEALRTPEVRRAISSWLSALGRATYSEQRRISDVWRRRK